MRKKRIKSSNSHFNKIDDFILFVQRQFFVVVEKDVMKIDQLREEEEEKNALNV